MIFLLNVILCTLGPGIEVIRQPSGYQFIPSFTFISTTALLTLTLTYRQLFAPYPLTNLNEAEHWTFPITELSMQQLSYFVSCHCKNSNISTLPLIGQVMLCQIKSMQIWSDHGTYFCLIRGKLNLLLLRFDFILGTNNSSLLSDQSIQSNIIKFLWRN